MFEKRVWMAAAATLAVGAAPAEKAPPRTVGEFDIPCEIAKVNSQTAKDKYLAICSTPRTKDGVCKAASEAFIKRLKEEQRACVAPEVA